jgi:glycosyltransferase involved in cell wall biosynthesis
MGNATMAAWGKDRELPLLSVIVANRNYGAYLGDCLESILRQTWPKLEIRIYDDASTDDSETVIRRYINRHPDRIHARFAATAQGPAHARHQAILDSAAPYITTLDSDDTLLDPDKLAAEMALIQKHERETGTEVIAFSNIVWVNERGERLGTWGSPETLREGMILAPILSRSHLIPRDFTLKRSLYLEAGGYDTSLSHYEDWDLKIRLAHRHPFYYTGLEGIAYRQHGSGLSSIPAGEHITKMRAIFNRHIHLVDKVFTRWLIRARFNTFLRRMQGKP